MEKVVSKFFQDSKPQSIGRAPARLDVMGGIADYSGSLVLQMPLNYFTTVSTAKRSDHKLRIYSKNRTVLYHTKHLLPDRGKIIRSKKWTIAEYERWALYAIGCVFVLLDEYDFEFKGLDIYIESEVPEGKGVSSSAALEIATLRSLIGLFNLSISAKSLAILGQKAENQVAEAPCGIMDQLASSLGIQNTLLPILCQPHKVYNHLAIPSGLYFSGLDCGVKHSVAGMQYGKVRTAAFMGLSIILQEEGISKKEILKIQQGLLKSKIPFDGYLANINRNLFKTKYNTLLPETMTGKAFKSKFRYLTDPLSKIIDDEIYDIKACTEHPILENHRISKFLEILKKEDSGNFKELGDLMLESHQGYLNCGLSCQEADRIIDLILEERLKGKALGGRITGGGNGGTICILATNKTVAKGIQKKYETQTSKKSYLFE